MFNEYYRGKRVLVTGHTGFKGSWLSRWLLQLGAQVIGYSLDPIQEPSHFELLGLADEMIDIRGDIRDLDHFEKVVNEHKPQVIFHLAAQPIVSIGYDDPKLTFETNMNGMLTVLEAGRKAEFIETMVLITSDKAYRNVEWEWGYRENDELGGYDPYSASKGAAELVFRSYAKSYYMSEKLANIATTRAGNVIGGGDWSLDRIVPDCVAAWAKGEAVTIRSPKATRPWQHVLEPLGGYLALGAALGVSDELNGESFNFGPMASVIQSVEELLKQFAVYWPSAKWNQVPSDHAEANLLKLCCDKALQRLKWQAVLDFDKTVEMTANWYRHYYEGQNAAELSDQQIAAYVDFARECGATWAK